MKIANILQENQPDVFEILTTDFVVVLPERHIHRVDPGEIVDPAYQEDKEFQEYKKMMEKPRGVSM